MGKLIMLIGISGSGKSQFAKELSKKERSVVVSTDEIRGELFGDDSKQKKTGLVFHEVYSRIDSLLQEGRNVVFDATNIDRDKRIKVLKKFHSVEKECYYFDTPYQVCLDRNSVRKRKVDQFILDKMYKKLHYPIKNEEWDEIHLVHENLMFNMNKESFINILQRQPSYEELFSFLSSVSFFNELIGFDQENPHHSHTLCWHTYHVLEYVNAFYDEEDKLIMQVVALMHDVGKPFCKTFKRIKGYYSYYGHEYVSAHIACHFLKELGFDDDFIHKASNLIQMHMKINYGGQEGASEIFRLLGEEILWKLYFFKEADSYAK